MSYGAQLRGLMMPEPLAFMEERKKGRVLGRSFVISEFIDDALRLSDIAMESAELFPSELLFRIGRELRRMHILGWYHGDLKWNNILIKKHGRSNSPYIFFLDIDGSSISAELAPSDVKKDLTRFIAEIDKFGLKARERDAFLSGYRCYSLGIKASQELTDIFKELGS